MQMIMKLYEKGIVVNNSLHISLKSHALGFSQF